MDNSNPITPAPIAPIEDSAIKLRHKKATELKILLVLSIFLAILIGAYLIFWQYTVKGSFYRVKVLGINVDKSTNLQDVNNKINTSSGAYRFSLQFPGQEAKQFALADAGIIVDASKTYQNAVTEKTNGNVLQKLRFWRSITVPLAYTTDEPKLEAFIKTEATKIIDKPVNASLGFAENSVVVNAEQDGNAYFDAQFKSKLTQAITSLQPFSLVFAKQAKPANITTEKLQSLKPQIEKSLQQTVALSINNKSFVADASIIKKWIDLPDFNTAEKFEYEVNSGNIQKYIDDIVRPYVRKGKAQIELQRSDGTNVVIAKGVVGSDVLEKQAIAKEIATSLKNGQSYQKTLTVSTAPMQIVDAKTYEKWIVVDVTNKYMEAYEKDQVVRKFLVSAGAPATPTALGQFTIRAKVRRQDMRGRNVDGSSYFQPNVEFVNYFYGGQAIHGNYWRPLSWFGNVNSSHGCVGLPNPEAEWVYNWAPIGTPIIIHN